MVGCDLPSIQLALEPYGSWDQSFGAFDCFAGLLVLDALVANTDRHRENWGIVEERDAWHRLWPQGVVGFNMRKSMRDRPREYAAGGRVAASPHG